MPDCDTKKLLPGDALDHPLIVYLDEPNTFSIKREHDKDSDTVSWSKVCKVGYELSGASIPTYVTLTDDKIKVEPTQLSQQGVLSFDVKYFGYI